MKKEVKRLEKCCVELECENDSLKWQKDQFQVKVEEAYRKILCKLLDNVEEQITEILALRRKRLGILKGPLNPLKPLEVMA
ncbi:hypothetical protein IMY05_014G0037900 [Salix suchowensis]|nr:hypothetical protein IMY05_014G0037900 [Salix suchowensis]